MLSSVFVVLIYNFSFSLAQLFISGLGNLVVEPLDHTHARTHTHTHTVGLLGTSDQLAAEAASYTTHNQHKRRSSVLAAGLYPRSQELYERRRMPLTDT